MREFVKHLRRKMHRNSFVKALDQKLWQIKRKYKGVDRTIISSYFAEQKIRRLHIGCGGNILGDWLNSDFLPHPYRILHLDATKTLPFPSETFDYIFSEHTIEHISYVDGLFMLTECHRVLKNNGKIRISTPNIQFLIDLYTEDKSELQNEYIKWSTDNYIKAAPYYYETFVLNTFVREWGHLFIYDERILRSSMEKAGFTKIHRCELRESEEELLRNLENEKRMPQEFLKLESVILEGSKAVNS